jgi:branched-chain amino acid transport system ATP-binding protein
MLHLKTLQRAVGAVPIIKGVDLQIENGQAIGLVGPNGCGKTSLLNLINGFQIAQTGSIVFNGHDISTLPVEERATLGVGRVFQSFGIFRNLTLFENLALAYTKDLSRKYKLLPITALPLKYKQEILAILEELELLDKKDTLAGNLSGGQMRLLEIARLYLQKTKLYLLDEPTAGVSPKLKSKVVDLLKKIIDKDKMVIIVEHDFEFLSQFVDSFALMDDGKIILQGEYKEIKQNPLTKSVYFGK